MKNTGDGHAKTVDDVASLRNLSYFDLMHKEVRHVTHIGMDAVYDASAFSGDCEPHDKPSPSLSGWWVLKPCESLKVVDKGGGKHPVLDIRHFESPAFSVAGNPYAQNVTTVSIVASEDSSVLRRSGDGLSFGKIGLESFDEIKGCTVVGNPDSPDGDIRLIYAANDGLVLQRIDGRLQFCKIDGRVIEPRSIGPFHLKSIPGRSIVCNPGDFESSMGTVTAGEGDSVAVCGDDGIKFGRITNEHIERVACRIRLFVLARQ